DAGAVRAQGLPVLRPRVPVQYVDGLARRGWATVGDGVWAGGRDAGRLARPKLPRHQLPPHPGAHPTRYPSLPLSLPCPRRLTAHRGPRIAAAALGLLEPEEGRTASLSYAAMALSLHRFLLEQLHQECVPSTLRLEEVAADPEQPSGDAGL